MLCCYLMGMISLWPVTEDRISSALRCVTSPWPLRLASPLSPTLHQALGRLANVTVDDFVDNSAQATVGGQLDFTPDERASSLSCGRGYAVSPSRSQAGSPGIASIRLQLKRPRSPTLIRILLSFVMERLSMVSFLYLPRTQASR